MSTQSETTSKVTTQLEKQIKAQGDQLVQLRTRVNELVDELFVVQQELNKFKKNVASDVKYLTSRAVQ